MSRESALEKAPHIVLFGGTVGHENGSVTESDEGFLKKIKI